MLFSEKGNRESEINVKYIAHAYFVLIYPVSIYFIFNSNDFCKMLQNYNYLRNHHLLNSIFIGKNRLYVYRISLQRKQQKRT